MLTTFSLGTLAERIGSVVKLEKIANHKSTADVIAIESEAWILLACRARNLLAEFAAQFFQDAVELATRSRTF